MRLKIKYASFFLGALLLVSCGTNKSGDAEKLPKAKTVEMLDVLDSLSGQSFDSFYTKISTKYQDSSRRLSFKTSVRIVEDSAVNALITFARIPVFNALVTADSVRVTNKREKCYIDESIDFIKQTFAVDFTHRNIEELIFGMPLGYDSTWKYFRVKDPFNYTVASHKKSEIQRLERKAGREWIAFYTLSDDLKNLKRTVIESPEDSTTLRIDYLERELVDGYQTPLKVHVTINTPREEVFVELNYNRTRVGKGESIHFVIPESYGKCK